MIILGVKTIVLDGQGELVGRSQHKMYTHKAYVLVEHESVTTGELQMSLRKFMQLFLENCRYEATNIKNLLYIFRKTSV